MALWPWGGILTGGTEEQWMDKEGTECVKEMTVFAHIQWGFLVGLWDAHTTGCVRQKAPSAQVGPSDSASPSSEPPSVMLLNGDCSETLKKEEGTAESPRENGLDEGEPGDETTGQEVIVIQDTGFSVKILAPGIEPFSLQVRCSSMLLERSMFESQALSLHVLGLWSGSWSWLLPGVWACTIGEARFKSLLHC